MQPGGDRAQFLQNRREVVRKAVELGIEAGAVKVRLHRAVQELRRIFLELPEEGAKWTAKRPARNLQIV